MNPSVCDPRRSFPTVFLYVDSGEVEPEADKQRMQPGQWREEEVFGLGEGGSG